MCIDCAVRTPVGYTCRECVRGHEDKFFEGSAVDYGLVAATCAVGGALTVFALMLIGGFLILGFIVAPAIGATAAQIALQLSGRRRGRYSGYVAAGGVLAGGYSFGAAAFRRSRICSPCSTWRWRPRPPTRVSRFQFSAMLEELRIQNFAVIDRLELQFGAGLQRHHRRDRRGQINSD